MLSTIELAGMITKCMAHKDLDLSDIVETVVYHCVDFIECVNDYHGIQEKQGIQKKIASGTERLLGILINFKIVNEELRIRLSELVDRYKTEETKETSLNTLKYSDFRLTDRILYTNNDAVTGLSTVVREGVLTSGVKVAVKIYTANNLKELKMIQKEIEVLSFLSGKRRCFLKLYGYCLEMNSAYIVTELCERSLAEDMSVRKSTNKPYTYDECIDIMNQLLEGFIFLSHNKINHQDIKPQNIMFVDTFVIKIIDFNVVIRTEELESTNSTVSAHTIQGTKGYMSPEVLSYYLANKGAAGDLEHKFKLGKSDIFSLGLVFLGLFTFDNLTGLNQEDRNADLQNKVKSVVSDNCVKELICKMLQLNPKMRPSFTKALAEFPGKTTKKH